MKPIFAIAVLTLGMQVTAQGNGVSHLVHEPRELEQEFNSLEAGYGIRSFEDHPDRSQGEFDIRGNYLVQKHFFIGGGFNNSSYNDNQVAFNQNEFEIGAGVRNVFVGARSEIDTFAYFDYLTGSRSLGENNETDFTGREFGLGLTMVDETFPDLIGGVTLLNRDYQDSLEDSVWSFKGNIGYRATPNLQLKLNAESSFEFTDPKLGAAVKLVF